MERTHYQIRTYDKDGNMMTSTDYENLREAKEAWKEKTKRIWIELEMLKVYEYEDTETAELIDHKEIEVNL